MSSHRLSRSRHTALVLAVSLALSAGSAHAQDPAPEPFPAYRDGHLVPSPDGDIHRDGTALAADVAQAARQWCDGQSTYPGCTLLRHDERVVPGEDGKHSAYSKLYITLELTHDDGTVSERTIDGGISLVRSCPVDAVIVTDSGSHLDNRDRYTGRQAVACISPDVLPKSDALGVPEESDANQCPVGNSPLVGNPINALTLSKIERVVDYAGPTSSGLTFGRTYHSGAFPLKALLPHIGARYIAAARIGARWRHTFDRAFVRRPHYDAQGHAYGTALYLIHDDGRETRFVKQGDIFVPVEGERGSLREHPEGGWVHTWPDLTEERYDDRGRLRTRTDANGNTLALHYDEITVGIGLEATVLVRVSDDQGRELRLSYDRLGRVETVDTPDGRINYSYSGDLLEGLDADLVEVGYPDGKKVAYLYDEPDMGGTPNHKLTGIVGKDGQRFATFHYDSNNRAIRSANGGDLAWTEVDASREGVRITSKDLRYGHILSPTYDHGRVRLGASEDDAIDASRTFEYLGGGLVARQTDYRGVPTSYRYDHARQLETERTEAEGTPVARTVTTSWHATFDKPTRIDDGARWTAFDYDAKGNLIETREGGLADAARPDSGPWPEERVTRYSYDDAGRLLTIDGPLAGTDDTTRYTYYDTDAPGCDATTCAWRQGDMHTVTDALGHMTTMLTYDAAGRVLASTDANGVRTDRRYDAMGRPVEIVLRARRDGQPSAADRVTRLSYTANGDLDTFTDADGVFLTHRYDAARRLVKQTDAVGNQRKIVVNGLGRMVDESYQRADGTADSVRHYAYDLRGLLHSFSYSDGSSRDYEYDANGRLTQVEDRRVPYLGYKAAYVRDARGRIQQVDHGYPQAGLTIQTKLAYDGSSGTKTVVDPNGLTTSYLRNGLGDLLWQQSPDTGQTAFAHDANGQPTEETPADDRTVKRTYDHLGRLTTATHRDGQTTTYTYDSPSERCGPAENFPMGRLTSVTESSGSTTLCYDFAGRVVRKIQTARGVSLDLRYEYSPAGRLLAMTYPDGRQVRYRRDGAGRVSSVEVQATSSPSQSIVTAVEHDALGRVLGWRAGTRHVQRHRDGMGNITGLADDRADGLNATITYYGFGTIGSIQTAADTKAHQVWIDTASRVTTGTPLTASGFGERYEYDSTGNRLRWWSLLPSVDRRFTYATDSHRLLTAHNVAREYDAAGNTTRIGEREFVYDATGRMSQAKVNGVVEMNYAYNAFGQQVAKHIAGQTTVSLHDEAGHWLGDYDAVGQPIRQVVWLDDLPVAALDGEAIRDIQPDHLGTPRVVIDRATDKAIWNWSLSGEAFGASAPNEDPDRDGTRYVFDMRFPGQRYDAVTGLFQNGWRDYDPLSGRYIQSDPIGLAGGISTYAYVGSNPYARVDPRGLDDSMCMFNPSACGWHKNPQDSHVTVGAGGWGNVLAGYGSGELGAAFDSTGNVCFYIQACRGVIAGLPVQGEVGAALGAGSGTIGLGTQTTYGTVVIGGAGVAGGGMVLQGDSGFSASKSILGVGGSPEGCVGGVAAVQCTTEYFWCRK